MPTIASQLKKSATVLYESETKESKIPFVSTTSTAPSHNVGVNVQKVNYKNYYLLPLPRIITQIIKYIEFLLQKNNFKFLFYLQILSGLKVQQPLFGIPMTMAHRMGKILTTMPNYFL